MMLHAIGEKPSLYVIRTDRLRGKSVLEEVLDYEETSKQYKIKHKWVYRTVVPKYQLYQPLNGYMFGTNKETLIKAYQDNLLWQKKQATDRYNKVVEECDKWWEVKDHTEESAQKPVQEQPIGHRAC